MGWTDAVRGGRERMRAMTAAPASTNTSTSRRGLPCERVDGALLLSDSEEEVADEEEDEEEEEAGSARSSGEAAGACCESSTKCCWLWLPPAAPALTLPLADSWRVRTSPDWKAGNGAIGRQVTLDALCTDDCAVQAYATVEHAPNTQAAGSTLSEGLRTRFKRAVRGPHPQAG